MYSVNAIVSLGNDLNTAISVIKGITE